MAGPSQRLSPAVAELLQCIRDEGPIASLMQELEHEFFDFEVVSGSHDHGSMTDASKRRMVEEPMPPRQMPSVAPSTRVTKSHGPSLLPAGVQSTEEWAGDGRKI